MAEETAQNTVIFVLGGPGSGKGTQCEKIVNTFGYVHFSAGDLLRKFVKSGTPEGNKLAEMMQQGQIVPSEVTVNLLKDAMKESGKTNGRSGITKSMKTKKETKAKGPGGTQPLKPTPRHAIQIVIGPLRYSQQDQLAY